MNDNGTKYIPQNLVYTSGDWIFGSSSDRFIVKVDGAGDIANILIDNGKNFSPPIEEAHGNAKLMTASPNLYIALKSILLLDGNESVDKAKEIAKNALNTIDPQE